MPEKNTCFTCKWWNVAGLPSGKGNCYLNPPQVVIMPVMNKITGQGGVQPAGIRPTTGALEYCHGYRSGLTEK